MKGNVTLLALCPPQKDNCQTIKKQHKYSLFTIHVNKTFTTAEFGDLKQKIN